ncbi:MAG: glycerol kinase [Betaproteobacteria bacterium RIFCSPLOWO2_12_FULL_65_14]|nr:MAG: glycerol kinase [Betaproteobacteria bacterium RIFCSPLOWO2_12_FULL_65_14]
MKYVLALDQGTTSSRAILFDGNGAPVAAGQRELRQIYPRPGWVEHDPREIFATQRDVAREALRKASVPLKDVMAIGISNQRETTIVWDRQSGEPVHNAIVWQDRRTTPFCQQLKSDGAEEEVRARTGLVIDPYFSGTKIAWLLDEIPGARGRAERGELAFGTVDTWLAWHLTGNRTHVTDVSNASRTLLFNIHSGDWDEELLRLLRVPRAILPEVHPSAHAFGMLPAGVLGEPLVIGGIAGDQQAAMFGQACHAPGMAKNTYGTGCFMLLHTGDKAVRSAHGLVATACAQVRAKEYALEGSVFIGGAVVQWLRDELKFFSSSHEVERLAAEVLDSGGVFVVPAFTGLGAPHWDPNARGAIVGLTRGTSRAHIARAALESIAFQSAEVLEAMQKDAGEKLSELRVDGGACANDLLMQFQADLLGVPVVKPRILETTALGAAYLAGLTVDLWKSREELASHWKAERRFEPRMNSSEREALMARWREAVGRSRNWARPGS